MILVACFICINAPCLSVLFNAHYTPQGDHASTYITAYYQLCTFRQIFLPTTNALDAIFAFQVDTP